MRIKKKLKMHTGMGNKGCTSETVGMKQKDINITTLIQVNKNFSICIPLFILRMR